MAWIFISYRQKDTLHEAHELYEKLSEVFKNQVFLDRPSIRVGNRWRDELKTKVRNARIVIAFIGRDWLKDGNDKRLWAPNDWVREEIEIALSYPTITLMPVHFGDEQQNPFLSPDQLPPSIQDLTEHQGLRIKPADEYEHGFNKLVEEIKLALEQPKSPPHHHPVAEQVVQLSYKSDVWHGYVLNKNTLITPTHHQLQMREGSWDKISLSFADGQKRTISQNLACGTDVCLIQFTPAITEAQAVSLAVGRPQRTIDSTLPTLSSKSYSGLFSRLVQASTTMQLQQLRLEYNVHARGFSIEDKPKNTSIGALFHENYLIGLIDTDGYISTPNDWQHEYQIGQHLPNPIQPRGWAYDPYIPAAQPSTHLKIYLYGDSHRLGVRIMNEAGLILDDRKAAFDSKFDELYTPLDLAQIFIDGKSPRLTQSNASTARYHALQLGLWLTEAIFGDVNHRKRLLQKAGWQKTEDLADRPVSLSIYAEDPRLEALPWRTLACKQSIKYGQKPCFLGQSCSWVVSIESEEQAQTSITIRRPAKVLLVGLQHNHADIEGHLEHIRRIIEHSETRFTNTHLIDIATTPQAFELSLQKYAYDLIYVYGTSLLERTDNILRLRFAADKETAQPQFYEVEKIKQELRTKTAGLLVVNTSGQNTEGWYELAEELKRYSGYLIINAEACEIETSRDYGLQLIRGLFRHAKAPEYLSWHNELKEWHDSRWYNPVIYKQAGAFEPQFKAIESFRSIQEILHQLDRENARNAVKDAISKTLKDPGETQALSFIYVGLPGNEVRGFAEGLSSFVDNALEDVDIVPIYVSALPEARPLEPKAIQKHIVHRLRTGIDQHQHQLAPYRKAHKQSLVVWVNWGFHVKEDPSAFTDQEIVKWHKQLKAVLSQADLGIPPKALVVTTYGKELSGKKDHKTYKDKLRKDFRTAKIRRGRLQVKTIIELENISFEHIERFIENAPHIFAVPDDRIDDVAEAIEKHSKGEYEEAQRLLRTLYIEGTEDFLAQYM